MGNLTEAMTHVKSWFDFPFIILFMWNYQNPFLQPYFPFGHPDFRQLPPPFIFHPAPLLWPSNIPTSHPEVIPEVPQLKSEEPSQIKTRPSTTFQPTRTIPKHRTIRRRVLFYQFSRKKRALTKSDRRKTGMSRQISSGSSLPSSSSTSSL